MSRSGMVRGRNEKKQERWEDICKAASPSRPIQSFAPRVTPFSLQEVAFDIVPRSFPNKAGKFRRAQNTPHVQSSTNPLHQASRSRTTDQPRFLFEPASSSRKCRRFAPWRCRISSEYLPVTSTTSPRRTTSASTSSTSPSGLTSAR